MKTFIRANKATPTGYEIVTINGDGIETAIAIDKFCSVNPHSLILPENPSNRKYFDHRKVDNNGGIIELTYKATKVLGPRSEQSERRPLEDYLSPEDKELYLSLVEKAKKNREEAHKKVPLTEVEKAERKIAKLQELIKQLQEKGE